MPRPEVPLDPQIPVLIERISEPVLREPLQQAILVDNLFKSPLFEYRNGTWFLSRRNMFELTQQSQLAPRIGQSTYDWLVPQVIIASETKSSAYSSNYRASKVSYYNQPDTLVWLCFAMTYHDLKTDTDRKRIPLASVRRQTMERLGPDHPLGSHFYLH